MLTLAAFSSHAALLCYEPFSPTGGVSDNLLNVTATGSGFADSWAQSYSNGDTGGGFTRPSDAGIFANGWPANVSFSPASGQAEAITTWQWQSLTRTMSSPLNFSSAGTYYLSFLVRDNGNNNYSLSVFLGNSASPNRIYMGPGYGNRVVNAGDPTTYPWWLPEVDTVNNWPGLGGNSLMFVVAMIQTDGAGNVTVKMKHYDYDPVAQTGDVVDIDPALVAWEATYTGTVSGTYDQFGISGAGQDSAEALTEIRLGTTWSEVTGTTDTAITWRGDGSANAWDTNTVNWVTTGGGTPSTYSDGFSVIIDNTGSNTPAINITAPVSPLSVAVAATGSHNYTIGGAAITGAATFTQSGNSTTVLNNPNSYTGSTAVANGTLTVSNALGNTASISISGGAILNLGGAATINGGSYGGAISDSGTLNFNSSAAQTLSGVISGAGAVNVNGSGTLTIDALENFSGSGSYTINSGILTVTTNGMLYGNGWTPNGVVTIGNGATLQVHGWGYGVPGGPGDLGVAAGNMFVNGGTIEYLGDGSQFWEQWFTVGSGGCTFKASGTGTWQMWGFNNQENTIDSSYGLTFTGAGNGIMFQNIFGSGSVTKSGAGTWKIDTCTCTYTGATIISAGTLALGGQGVGGSINNSSNIVIAAGATFDVSAQPTYTLSSSTALSASGTASPATINTSPTNTVSLGAQPVKLTFDGSHPALTLAQGTLSLSGNPFTVITGSALAPGVYTLVSTPNPVSGTVNPAPSYAGGSGVAIGTTGMVSISGNDVILTVASTIPNTPTNITYTVSSGHMTISWPAGYLGWILQSQTNALTKGLGTNWVDVPGTAAVTSTNLPIDPANPTMFYRLRR